MLMISNYIYADSETNLERFLEITSNFSRDIKMQLGTDKYVKLVALRGKIRTYYNLVGEIFKK